MKKTKFFKKAVVVIFAFAALGVCGKAVPFANDVTSSHEKASQSFGWQQYGLVLREYKTVIPQAGGGYAMEIAECGIGKDEQGNVVNLHDLDRRFMTDENSPFGAQDFELLGIPVLRRPDSSPARQQFQIGELSSLITCIFMPDGTFRHCEFSQERIPQHHLKTPQGMLEDLHKSCRDALIHRKDFIDVNKLSKKGSKEHIEKLSDIVYEHGGISELFVNMTVDKDGKPINPPSFFSVLREHYKSRQSLKR